MMRVTRFVLVVVAASLLGLLADPNLAAAVSADAASHTGSTEAAPGQPPTKPTAEHQPVAPAVSRVEPTLLKAVVKIQAPATAHTPAAIGAGFLVSCGILSGDRRQQLFFLITNKHVIGDWTLADGDILEYRKSLDLFLYGGPGGGFTVISVPLLDGSGTVVRNRVRLAPDRHVDVAAVFLNDIPVPVNPPLTFNTFDPTYLLPFDKIAGSLTGLGDQVFALGYPLGVTSAKTSYPIAKAGYLATTPGEVLSIDVPTSGRNGNRTSIRLDGKLLVVDGLIVPGNSGGPIVLPSELKVRRNPITNELEFATEQTKNLIIGIVSEAIGGGLTLCYSSDYVLELVSSFLSDLSPASE